LFVQIHLLLNLCGLLSSKAVYGKQKYNWLKSLATCNKMVMVYSTNRGNIFSRMWSLIP
jgi:hypothetical protein